MSHTRPIPLAPAFAVLFLAACGPSEESLPTALGTLDLSGPETLFLVQSEPATAVMEAFFQGRVVRDAAGCLRLEASGSDGATVVWPHGFTLDTAGDELRVRDDGAREVGRIGGEFRFGGGFVQTLHEGIPIAGSPRAEAAARCPGSFWIVGELP